MKNLDIDKIKKELLENDFVSKVEFLGRNDSNCEFLITSFDGIEETWEVRIDKNVYFYNKSEDNWEHIYQLKI